VSLVLLSGCAAVGPAMYPPVGAQSPTTPTVEPTPVSRIPTSTRPPAEAASQRFAPLSSLDSPDPDALLFPTRAPAPRGVSMERFGGAADTTRSDSSMDSELDPRLDPVFKFSPAGSSWGEGDNKSYWIPAAEIVGFQILLNQFNQHFNQEDVYRTNLSTIEDNLHSGWIIDNDPFATNQLLHPYQGSLYHGFARSAGLNYWEALGYDFVGSAVWEVAGETGSPSLNDQITTTVAGSFLGEALFRMSSYLLERGGEHPGFFRELGAAVTAPSAAFNRFAFGERFESVYQSHEPAVYTRVGAGVRQNTKRSGGSTREDVPENEFVADFVMDYGLPGKSTYDYTRPFDYFHFEAAAVSNANALPEDVMVRGLLCGAQYEEGSSYRGIWGLYGGYDYIAPEVFSVSSTSLSLGTTAQWWLSDKMALQGTLLGGAGWAAIGTISDAAVDRSYHYGISPQSLLALRVNFGELAVLDFTGRAYYLGPVSDRGSEDSETVFREKIALTVRVFGHNALGVQYVASSRDSRFPDSPDQSQSIGAVSLFYTYISDTKFGAVAW
jgi:hypothetical protein